MCIGFGDILKGLVIFKEKIIPMLNKFHELTSIENDTKLYNL